MDKDLRTTGEYNQLKGKIRSMLELASGYKPLPNFTILNKDAWIFVMPINDASRAGDGFNSWGIIVVNDASELSDLLRNLDAYYKFGQSHISRFGIQSMIRLRVSTKLGKEKASEKIADFIFDLEV